MLGTCSCLRNKKGQKQQQHTPPRGIESVFAFSIPLQYKIDAFSLVSRLTREIQMCHLCACRRTKGELPHMYENDKKSPCFDLGILEQAWSVL